MPINDKLLKRVKNLVKLVKDLKTRYLQYVNMLEAIIEGQDKELKQLRKMFENEDCACMYCNMEDDTYCEYMRTKGNPFRSEKEE